MNLKLNYLGIENIFLDKQVRNFRLMGDLIILNTAPFLYATGNYPPDSGGIFQLDFRRGI